jgi:putative endonuclease
LARRAEPAEKSRGPRRARGKRRIVATAELWLARHPQDAQHDIRFDVILVTPGRIPQHIANAFDATR